MFSRLALRLITVRALRGRTLAGATVLDSETAPIEDVAEDHPTPVIIVYTDDCLYNLGGTRDLYSTSGDGRVGSGAQKLVIEVVLTQRMALVDEGGQVLVDEAGEPVLGALSLVTSATLEAMLDVIERQIRVALMDPNGAWAKMWRRLVVGVTDIESQRGASNRDGVRFAGRQITISVQLPKDPPPGRDAARPGTLWGDFLALAGGEPDLAPLLPVLRAALADTADPTLTTAAGFLGLSVGEQDAMRVAVAGGTP